MDAVIKKELLKGISLTAVLIAFNLYSGFNLVTIVLSLLFILLLIAGDVWILLPLKKKTGGIVEAIDDLASGGKGPHKKDCSHWQRRTIPPR
jgi:hypothetical protein